MVRPCRIMPDTTPQLVPTQASWVCEVEVSMAPAPVMTLHTPLAPASNLE